MLAELEKKLEKFKNHSIEKLKITDTNNQLELTITTIDGEKTTIKFKNVKGYYYQDFENINNIQFNKFQNHLNLISYYEEGFARFSKIDLEDLDNTKVSVPNFVINLINSTLFIESSVIEIDNNDYKVDYMN